MASRITLFLIIALLTLSVANEYIWFDYDEEMGDGQIQKETSVTWNDLVTGKIHIAHPTINEKKLDVIFLLNLQSLGGQKDMEEFKAKWPKIEATLTSTVGGNDWRVAFVPYKGDSSDVIEDSISTRFFKVEQGVTTGSGQYSSVTDYLTEVLKHTGPEGHCRENHLEAIRLTLPSSDNLGIFPGCSDTSPEEDCVWRDNALHVVFVVTSVGILPENYGYLNRVGIAFKNEKVYVNTLSPASKDLVPCKTSCNDYVEAGDKCRIVHINGYYSTICQSGKPSICDCDGTQQSCTGTQACEDYYGDCYQLKDLTTETGGSQYFSLSETELAKIKSNLQALFEKADSREFNLLINKLSALTPVFIVKTPSVSESSVDCSTGSLCEIELEAGPQGCGSPHPCEVDIDLNINIKDGTTQGVYPYRIQLVSTDGKLSEELVLDVNVQVPVRTEVSFQGYELPETTLVYFEIKNIGEDRVLNPGNRWENFTFYCDMEEAQLYIHQVDKLGPGESTWGVADCLKPMSSDSIDVSLHQDYGPSGLDKLQADQQDLVPTKSNYVFDAHTVFNPNKETYKVSVPGESPDIILFKLIDQTNSAKIIKAEAKESGVSMVELAPVELETVEDTNAFVVLKTGDKLSQLKLTPSYDYFSATGLKKLVTDMDFDGKDWIKDGLNDIYVFRQEISLQEYKNFTLDLAIDIPIEDSLSMKITDDAEGYLYEGINYGPNSNPDVQDDGYVRYGYEKPIGSNKMVLFLNASLKSPSGQLKVEVEGKKRSRYEAIIKYAIRAAISLNVPTSMLIVPNKEKTSQIEIQNLQTKADSFTICGSGSYLDVSLEGKDIMSGTSCFSTGTIPAGESRTYTLNVLLDSEEGQTLRIEATSDSDAKVSASQSILIKVASFSDSNMDGECTISEMLVSCDFAFNNAGNTDNTYYYGFGANILLATLGWSNTPVSVEKAKLVTKTLSNKILPYQLTSDEQELVSIIGQAHAVTKIFAANDKYKQTAVVSSMKPIIVKAIGKLDGVGETAVVDKLRDFQDDPTPSVAGAAALALDDYYGSFVEKIKGSASATTQKSVKFTVVIADSPVDIDGKLNATLITKEKSRSFSFKTNIELQVEKDVNVKEGEVYQYEATIKNMMQFPIFVDYTVNALIDDDTTQVKKEENVKIDAKSGLPVKTYVDLSNAKAERHRVNLLVKPVTEQSPQSESTTIRITREKIIDFEVTSDYEELSGLPGERVIFTITVKNTGTTPSVFNLMFNRDELYTDSINLGAPSTVIKPGTEKDVELTVDIPSDQIEDMVVDLTVYPKDVEDKAKNLQLSVKVIVAQLSWNVPPILDVAKKNFTVSNDGDADDNVEFTIEGDLSECVTVEVANNTVAPKDTIEISLINECRISGQVELRVRGEKTDWQELAVVEVEKADTVTVKPVDIDIDADQGADADIVDDDFGEKESSSGSSMYIFFILLIVAAGLLVVAKQKQNKNKKSKYGAAKRTARGQQTAAGGRTNYNTRQMTGSNYMNRYQNYYRRR